MSYPLGRAWRLRWFTSGMPGWIRAHGPLGERLGLCVESPTRQFQEAAVAEEPTEFWGALAIDPVEIALPSGSGFTLRAYRSSTDVEGTDVSEREPEDDPFAARASEAHDEDDLLEFDEDELTRQALGEADESDAEESDAEEDRSGRGKREKADDTSIDL